MRFNNPSGPLARYYPPEHGPYQTTEWMDNGVWRRTITKPPIYIKLCRNYVRALTVCITRGTSDSSQHIVAPPLLLPPRTHAYPSASPPAVRRRSAPAQSPCSERAPSPGRCGRLKRQAAHARINSRQSLSMQTLSPCRPIRPAEQWCSV